MNLRYVLEPYSGRSSRYTCLQCRQAHQFVRYVDTATGYYVAEQVGRCNEKVCSKTST